MQENVDEQKNYCSDINFCIKGKRIYAPGRSIGGGKMLFITFLSSHRELLCRRCQLSFVIFFHI